MIMIALAVSLGSLSASVIAPAEAHAQPLPTPLPLVSGLDLECYQTQGPPLNINVLLSHLNPVLLALGLPPHQVAIRELVQTCVPVRKNNVLPQATAFPFIRHIDFACYRLEAAAISPVPLTLRHLNPVLANLPAHDIRLLRPTQLCVPVAKNGVLPPAQVQALVRFIDLECWEVEEAPHPVFTVNVGQLNPQLINPIPPHPLTAISDRRQLCVPVRKNNQAIPAATLNIVRWIDLEKFAAQPVVIAAVPLTLNHLNPLFSTLPPVNVVLQVATSLMVPVSKNGATPPP